FRRVRARAATRRIAGGLELRRPARTRAAGRCDGRVFPRHPGLVAAGTAPGRLRLRGVRVAIRGGRGARFPAGGRMAAGTAAGLSLQLLGDASHARGDGDRSGGGARAGNRRGLGRSRCDPDAALAAVGAREEEAVTAWGIIGCGAVTEVKSGPALQHAKGSSLVAVMRRDRAKAEDYARRHGVPRWYDDAQALIADPGVDAVYVATPPSTHAHYAIAAMRAGKPAYVEKPMALDG